MSNRPNAASFINSQLQLGVGPARAILNRFSGFSSEPERLGSTGNGCRMGPQETAKTVEMHYHAAATQLKLGVNERIFAKRPSAS